MINNTPERSERKAEPRLSAQLFKLRVHSCAEHLGVPGSSLERAWVNGAIDRHEYEAGRRLAELWQSPGHAERQARLAAGHALLPLGPQAAYVLASVCRDNGGLGNPERAQLLKRGLAALVSHFALAPADRKGVYHG